MNEVTDEWIAKAESDNDQAHLAMYAVDIPITDGVCFHSQQCAEKYLKAFLTENLVEFPRAHSLIPLLELCLPLDSTFETLRSDLLSLDNYAVVVRYPGARTNRGMAEAALAAATRVRAFVRNKFQLE